MKKMLIISLLINILFLLGVVVYVYQKGGVSYLKKRFGYQKVQYPASYYERLEILNSLPGVDSAIVFVGNSIIEQCECSELFGSTGVLNRGISHDKIKGLINRSGSIIKLNPVKLFILIGINDLANGLDTVSFRGNYDRMTRLFKTKLPETEINLISILPTNSIARKNSDIITANRIIKEISEKYHCNFLDIFSGFLERNNMNPEYTNDGLHLSGLGYKKLKEELNKFVYPSE